MTSRARSLELFAVGQFPLRPTRQPSEAGRWFLRPEHIAAVATIVFWLEFTIIRIPVDLGQALS